MGFDAFKYVDDLRDAGFSDKQAEAQIKVLSSVMKSELATKHDIELVRRDIELVKKEIETVKTGLKRDMKEMETNLKKEIAEYNVNLPYKLHRSDDAPLHSLR